MDNDNSTAFQEAEHELLRKDFFKNREGYWEGSFDIQGHKIKINISLPEDFPYSLPLIKIDRGELPRRIPHVERNGKLCIAESTGILIDVERPREIINESLRRAQALLSDGLQGKNDYDFITEFNAYWTDGAKINFYSICQPVQPSREISLLKCKGSPFLPNEQSGLFVDNVEIGKQWLHRLSIKLLGIEEAWLYYLSHPFIPPDYDSRFRTRDLVNCIKQCSTPADYDRFKEWLTDAGLPCFVLLCAPISETSGEVLFAVKLEGAYGENRKKAKSGGFYKTPPPVLREFGLTFNQSVMRISVERLDSQYMLPRGGASLEHRDSIIALVGCGAIGSYLAERLASLGIKEIRLIDNELLTPENVYRHILGIEHIHLNKSSALKTCLERRYPHTHFDYKDIDLREILRNQVDYIMNVDLLCIAIGNETLELMLNEKLQCHTPRIHTWVEPLGLGGHVFATGLSDGGGCFRCLFERDDIIGLNNKSALAKAGQNFLKSYAGCSGVFSPFGATDADRTAIEAATLAAEILRGLQKRNILVSWFGNPDTFLKSGYMLSQRSKLFQPGETRKYEIFQSENCVCKSWKHPD